MDEKQIIAMLWNREEDGIKALQDQYAAKLKMLAGHFVSAQDAEECMNDVLLAYGTVFRRTGRTIYLRTASEYAEIRHSI